MRTGAHVTTNTIQQHVRDDVEDFVAVCTQLVDGAIHVLRRRLWYGGPCRLEESSFELYVHPKTGILLENRFIRSRSFAEWERVARV